MDKNKHIEAIEACRSGTEDLADFPDTQQAVERDASLRAFAVRVSQFDQRIAQLMPDVEPPAGLADRLHVAMESHVTVSKAGSVSSRFGRNQSARRWNSFAIGIAICAGFLMLASSFAFRMLNRFEMGDLVEVYEQTEDRDWTAYNAGLLPDGYSLPVELKSTLPIGWQQLSTSVDPTSQFVLLGPNAQLLMVRTNRATSFPNKPLVHVSTPTGGYSYTAWAKGQLVYLVAVKGSRVELDKLFLSRPVYANYRQRAVNFQQPS